MRLLLVFTVILHLIGTGDRSEVVEVNGVPADKIYSSVKEWFAISFKSANDVIQLDSKEKVIGKGLVFIDLPGKVIIPVSLHFTIAVDIKDNKYRYSISNIYTSSRSALGSMETPLADYYKMTDPTKVDSIFKATTGLKVGKKIKEQSIESNKRYVTIFESEIEKIITSLKSSIESEDDDW